jgi:hypothetical protein
MISDISVDRARPFPYTRPSNYGNTERPRRQDAAKRKSNENLLGESQ